MPIYEKLEAGSCLRQGEIFTDLMRSHVNVEAISKGAAPTIDGEVLPYAILISQDCDLEQDHRAQREPSQKDKLLPDLLFLPAWPADQFKGTIAPGRELWKATSNNKNERYQVIETVPAEADAAAEGLPALGIDFKRCFSMRSDEVRLRLREGSARRRARLTTPYAEHLSCRFAYFLSRLGLPKDHEVS